jgi:hypothetical protein
MIKAAEIRNFKCFRSLELPDLSRVNVIGGANNVGKTSLLEAFFLFHDRRSEGMFLKHYGWRGMPTVLLDPAHLLAPYFHGLDLSQAMVIRMQTEKGRWLSAEYAFNPGFRPPKSTGATFVINKSEGIATTQDTQGSYGVDMTFRSDGDGVATQHLYVVEDRLQLYCEQTPPPLPPAVFLPARARPSQEEEAARMSEVVESKRVGDVEKFLKMMAREVKNLQLSTSFGKPTVCCDIGLPRLVPLGLAGDGLTRLLSIVLAMVNAQHGLVLIDEIENGIHYSVQEAFWRAIAEAAKDLDCQVVATTHSHEFLLAAHAGLRGLFEPDFRYIRLDRKPSGETTAKTFDYETLGAALEARLEVR